MTDIVIIPARKGSKRLVGKNILPLGGKPLVQYTLDYADLLKKSFDIDVVVSSDDQIILEMASNYDFFLIKRDDFLSGDSAKTVDVCIDAVTKMANEYGLKYELIHLFQVTSPFRKIEQFNNFL